MVKERIRTQKLIAIHIFFPWREIERKVGSPHSQLGGTDPLLK